MQPDAPVVFFVDASLGRYIIPGALRQAGVGVVAHDDEFAEGTADEIWLAEAGRQRWIVITKDQRIRHRESERTALSKAGVGAFVLVGKNITGRQMASALIAAMPKMLRIARSKERPFIATVGPTGGVRMLEGI